MVPSYLELDPRESNYYETDNATQMAHHTAPVQGTYLHTDDTSSNSTNMTTLSGGDPGAYIHANQKDEYNGYVQPQPIVENIQGPAGGEFESARKVTRPLPGVPDPPPDLPGPPPLLAYYESKIPYKSKSSKSPCCRALIVLVVVLVVLAALAGIAYGIYFAVTQNASNDASEIEIMYGEIWYTQQCLAVDIFRDFLQYQLDTTLRADSFLVKTYRSSKIIDVDSGTQNSTYTFALNFQLQQTDVESRINNATRFLINSRIVNKGGVSLKCLNKLQSQQEYQPGCK